MFFQLLLAIILTPVPKQWGVARIDPDRKRGREVEVNEMSKGEAQGKGHMDYSVQVVTSPDSALYSRELRYACPRPVSVE